jgi:hypothetical protein
MGRSRKFCLNCTPRSAADKEAARINWGEVAFERSRRHAEVLRGYYDDWQVRIAAGEQ